MNRYITITDEYDFVHVFHESDEKYKEFLENKNWSDYIWQFAKNPYQAKIQHFDKVEQWTDDINAGRKEKETY